MSTLHLVFSAEAYQSCITVRSGEDPVVLLGDGCYALVGDTPGVLAIESDTSARGIRPPPQVDLIDYGSLVDLVAACDRCASWT